METKIVLCPFCDREHRVELERTSVRCKCGGVFSVNRDEGHPSEFWVNPETSHRF